MIVIVAAFLALIVLLFFALITFDSLVRIEYRRHNQEWINDGKPKGFFGQPPGTPLFGGSLATQKLSFLWLFKSPHWIKSDTEAHIHLRRLRRLVLIFNAGAILWLMIIMAIKT